MMKRDDEALLEGALQAWRTEKPSDEQLGASAQRIAGKLGLDSFGIDARSMSAAHGYRNDAIENCSDVRQALEPYRTGTLSEPRALLIRAHLRECGACDRFYKTGSRAANVDWSAPRPRTTLSWKPRAFAWAMAPTFALLAVMFFVYRAFWQVPPGVRAEVQSIDGSAYRLSSSGDRQLAPGDKLLEGEQLRTSGGGHAVLRLADGSTVEINERSLLAVGERGRNTTIALDNGAVIVQAAHRDAGHLYLDTPDCRVAVTGTVFSVNAGIKGARVAVLEGSLHVAHAGSDTLVKAGDQLSTNSALTAEPVVDQIAWSHDRDKYFLLLAQFDQLQHRLDAIPTPALRYSSDLLARVPADTLLYISIPNLGDFLSQANSIFHDQLQQSPALRQWWESGKGSNSAELDTLVDRLHQVSQYLGDEVVIAGVKQTASPAFAIMADVKKDGLEALLRNESLILTSAPRMIVFNEGSLAAASNTTEQTSGGYALVRPHEVVFSNSIAMLRQANAQLSAGSGSFAASSFGQQVAAAYARGAGMILAADLQRMMVGHADATGPMHLSAENSGINDLRYLIAEHREKSGLPENHLNLQFAGTRKGVASWLAAPAPMASLEFVSPNAAVVTAFLSKDPAAIADDIMNMTLNNGQDAGSRWSEAEKNLHIDLRNDLAANLGGDFLVALDGPVLPTPAWKAVIEVHDADRMEQTIEKLIEQAQSRAGESAQRKIAIDAANVEAQRFYTVRDVTSGATLAAYTFADGYMIIAQSRAELMRALEAHSSGNSLAHSQSFKALLPADANANYSAIAYQNLSPVLAPLLSNVNGDLADAVRQLAADARPTAICAWGRDSTIEAASNSHLLGFDFLALGALLHPNADHSGNKAVIAGVRE